MAGLKMKDIVKMSKSEREDKLKELKIELIRAKTGKKTSGASPKEIRKGVARILTFIKLNTHKKKLEEQKKQEKYKEVTEKKN